MIYLPIYYCSSLYTVLSVLDVWDVKVERKFKLVSDDR